MITTQSVAVVTGGSSGIGRGIALALAAAGARTVVAARDPARLEATVRAMAAGGGVGDAVSTDVSREADVMALFSHVDARYGRLDILVNCAGILGAGAIEELTYEDWSRVIGVNLTGAFLCTREAMRRMKPAGGGRILNIGSISAQMPRPNTSAYAASKAGLVGLTRASALEGREHGISVGCLHPGNVLTEMREDAAPEMNREPMMTVDEITRLAMAALGADPALNVFEMIALPVGQEYLGRG